MERKVIILCTILGCLGIASAGLSFAAEVKRIKATEIQVDTTSPCIFPASPAFALASTALVFLTIAQAVITLTTGCVCVRRQPEELNFRVTVALLSSAMSWFTFWAALLLLISGAALSYKNGEESTIFDGNYYCFVIKGRIFALGGLLSLATVGLGILTYIIVNSADNLVDPRAPPAAPGLHGIAMGSQAQLSPQSSELSSQSSELSPQSSEDPAFDQEGAHVGQEIV